MNSMLFGNYRTRKFTDIFDDFESFYEDYSDLPSELKKLTESQLEAVFYLLYANYGNSHITNTDENQFKYKLFTTIYMYGPVWIKKREIQEAILAMDLNGDDILRGTSAIYNHAYNPNTDPATDTNTPLPFINDQNTTSYKRSKIDAYANLYALIDNDLTREFINRFKNLFLHIVEPQEPLWYITDEDSDEEA